MAADAAPIEMVTISAARLAELEALVDINAKMKEKLLKYNHSSIERLKKYKETHPDTTRDRSQKYRERDREAYNARRRELRRLKKEAAVATTPDGGSTHGGGDDSK
jgi:hypothetical protein